MLLLRPPVPVVAVSRPVIVVLPTPVSPPVPIFKVEVSVTPEAPPVLVPSVVMVVVSVVDVSVLFPPDVQLKTASASPPKKSTRLILLILVIKLFADTRVQIAYRNIKGKNLRIRLVFVSLLPQQ